MFVRISSIQRHFYQDRGCRFIDEFDPANACEEELAQSLADTRWHLLRIAVLEANL